MDPNMNVGSSQDFRLTWVNYSQKLTESFHKFLTSEILCNVTLWVHENGGGNSIKAHQAILSACSPWFEKILSQNQHPHPIIILKDVRYHDLKNIIRFIYTGEVFVPQHDLQDFLRTAELLEIKGLLKDDAAWPPQGLASLFQAPVSPGPPPPPPPPQSQKQQQHNLPNLPTVPVSSLLLPTGNTTSIVSGHITEGTQIHDLVSQIKVPVTLPSQPVSKTLLSTNNGEPKRRKIDVLHRRGTTPNIGVQVNNTQQQQQKARRVLTTTAGPVATHIVVEESTTHGAGPMMSQATVEEDGVSWIDEGGSGPCHETGLESSNLSPAEWVATGINDCGAFKRVWAERYLCYNLGREIICLLCFCRFTQFKKFNLERHMKNKHPQMYSLNETARREILEQFVARYIDHVSPDNVNTNGGGGSAGDRNHDVASEILAIGPIQVEGLNLDTSGTGPGGGGPAGSDPHSLHHEIKVENDPLGGPGGPRVVGSGPGGQVGPNQHPGTSKEPNRDPRSQGPPDSIMVELGEPDSEMLLVK